MRALSLFLLVTLSSCVRNQPQSPTWEEEDKSIRFPTFYDRFPVQVGKEGTIYDLDGETLRALNIAAADFIRPESSPPPCWKTREAHRYRVIRQGDLIFVRIALDHDYCAMGFGLLDYGVAYAIRKDGRILRRLYAGEPEDLSSVPSLDAGSPGPEHEVDSSMVGATTHLPVDCDFLRMLASSPRYKSSRPLPEECQVDGGTHPTPSPPDGSAPPPPPQLDGGTLPSP